MIIRVMAAKGPKRSCCGATETYWSEGRSESQAAPENWLGGQEKERLGDQGVETLLCSLHRCPVDTGVTLSFSE